MSYINPERRGLRAVSLACALGLRIEFLADQPKFSPTLPVISWNCIAIRS